MMLGEDNREVLSHKNETQCHVASNMIARGIGVPAVGMVNFEVSIFSD